jgi:hypothetical protein
VIRGYCIQATSDGESGWLKYCSETLAGWCRYDFYLQLCLETFTGEWFAGDPRIIESNRPMFKSLVKRELASVIC